jgi:hypothetical protein
MNWLTEIPTTAGLLEGATLGRKGKNAAYLRDNIIEMVTNPKNSTQQQYSGW